MITGNVEQQVSPPARPPLKPIRHLRWWIGGLLFAMAVVNFIDRQTINVLALILKRHHRWTNSQFALLAISLPAGYTIMERDKWRPIDRFGTRLGLRPGAAFYSAL